MNLNFNHLFYFHTATQTGSFSAAARELGVTVPTVSEQIKQLETSLGYRLFDRTGSGLRLTDPGRLAAQHTSVMFRESQRMLDRLDRQPTSERHLLEIGVVSTVSSTFAADYFLALFEMDHVFVRIQSGEDDHMLRSLLFGDIDLLVTDDAVAEAETRGLVTEVIHRPRMVVVGAAELADRVSSFPADLADVPFLHYNRASRYRLEIDRYFREHGVVPRVIGEVGDVGIMRTVAQKGVAVAILPSNAIVSSCGSLATLGELPRLKSDVTVAYKSERPSDVIRSAVEALKAAPVVAA